MYDFAYFSSGDTIKFVPANANPQKAIGTWTCNSSAIPVEGATVNIGGTIYTFKTTPTAPYDVKRETNTSATVLDFKEKTTKNLYAAINGDISLAASASGFFPGTAANTKVNAELPTQNTDYGVLSVTLTALIGGVTGNSIVTTTTLSGHSFASATLTGGEDPPEPEFELTVADLALAGENTISENDALVTTIPPFGVSQKAAAVAYWALEQDYKPLVQKYVPDNRNAELALTGSSVQAYDLPFVISTSDAYGRVSRVALKEADKVVIQDFRLGQAYLTLEPSDVIMITIAPFQYTLRIDEATLNGDFSTSFSAYNYAFRTDVPVGFSDVASVPQTIATGSDAIPVIIDAPVLYPEQGTIPGEFNLLTGVRAYRSNFSYASLAGGRINAEDEANLEQIYGTSNDLYWATGTAPTAVEPYYRTVEDSITLSCKTIDPELHLATATYQQCVAGENCLAYGSPETGWEFIYFRDVEVLNAKTVRLTGLIRAQRGTDAFVSHTASDVFVLLASVASGFSPSARSTPSAVEYVDTEWRYSAAGQPATRPPVLLDITQEGYQLYPFSPCQLAAAPGASSSIDISWERRDRLETGATWITEDPVLSETSEEYELEILSGSTVVRTVTGLTSPTYNYSSANQTADGFTPPLATVKVRVYQVGELGRGFPREETLNVI
jgi:hypothetical protein